MDIEGVLNWIENGKQIGKRYEYQTDEGEVYANIGVQKDKDLYKVYMSKILESRFATPEEDLIEFHYKFKNISDVIDFVENQGLIRLKDLAPMKGSKIFDVKGIYWDEIPIS